MNPSDKNLLQRWSANRDEDSFRELCLRHAGLVAAVCRRLGSPDADEAAQAVFLVLARRAGSVDATHLAGWLSITTRRVVADQHRSRARRHHHERTASMEQARQRDTATAEPGWEDARQHLDAGLAVLSANQREAIVRFYLEGKPQAEIAHELGCSVDAVKTRIHKGLQRLRDAFTHHGVTLGATALASGLASEAAGAEPAVAQACAQAVLAPATAPGATALASGVVNAMYLKAAAIAATAVLAIVSATIVTLVAGTDIEPKPVPPALPAHKAFLTPSQREEIQALYSQAVSTGLPDALGATLVVGPIAGGRRGQDGRDGDVFHEDGLHLHLADGRWLINGVECLRPDAPYHIEPDPKRQVVSLANLTAAVAVEADRSRRNWRIGHGDLLAKTDQTRVATALAASGPLGLGGRDNPVCAMHLLRLSVPGSEALLVLASEKELLPRRLVDPAPLRFNGPVWQDAAWKEQHTGNMVLPDPVSAARRALCGWFCDLVAQDTAMAAGLTRAQAIAGALAMAESGQRDALRARLELLTACLSVPDRAPADADLATRLQSWGRIPADSWQPRETDVPILLSLIEDPRPSRWVDCSQAVFGTWSGNQPHTLGDNALRALAAIVGFDPRKLVGRSVLTPWTVAERAACAQELRQWWARSGSRPLGDALAATIATLPVPAQAEILSAAAPELHTDLLDAIAPGWAASTPSPEHIHDIARILHLAGDHRAIAETVKAWPAEGTMRPLLAYWRDRHDEPAALDALLAEILATKPPSDTLGPALFLGLSTPSPARVQMMTTLARVDPADRRLWQLLEAILGPPHHHTAAWSAAVDLAWDAGGPTHIATGTGAALPLTLAALLLDDRRPVPEGLLTVDDSDWSQTFARIADIASFRISCQDHRQPSRPVPTGLRVRDLALIGLEHALRYLDPDIDPALRPVDLWAPRDQFDAHADALLRRYADLASPSRHAAGF